MSFKKSTSKSSSRRDFLKTSAKTAIGLTAFAVPFTAHARKDTSRTLSFYHTHTRQKLDVTYAYGNSYDIKALRKVDYFLRDFRTGEVFPIDRKLLDSLWLIQQDLGNKGVFDVISGYRSPATNNKLRTVSNGVAKRSLHMQGKAIDVRFPKIPTRNLQQCAVALQCGGVGYYPDSNFVHIDTGRVRTW